MMCQREHWIGPEAPVELQVDRRCSHRPGQTFPGLARSQAGPSRRRAALRRTAGDLVEAEVSCLAPRVERQGAMETGLDLSTSPSGDRGFQADPSGSNANSAAHPVSSRGDGPTFTRLLRRARKEAFWIASRSATPVWARGGAVHETNRWCASSTSPAGSLNPGSGVFERSSATPRGVARTPGSG